VTGAHRRHILGANGSEGNWRDQPWTVASAASFKINQYATDWQSAEREVPAHNPNVG
jgi:hypothetical protein